MSNALELGEWLEVVRPGFVSAAAGLTGSIASVASLLHMKSYIFNPWQTLNVAGGCALVAVIFGFIGYAKSRNCYPPNNAGKTLATIGFILAAVGLLVNGAQLLFNL
jgi:hypothetical protein